MSNENLTPQSPAQGIMKWRSFEKSHWYQITCDCGSDDHTASIEVEKSTDGDISMHIGAELETHWWDKPFEWKTQEGDWNKKFLYTLKWNVNYYVNSFLHRVKVTWNVWVHGKAKYSAWILLNEQQAVNIAAALNESINNLKEEQ